MSAQPPSLSVISADALEGHMSVVPVPFCSFSAIFKWGKETTQKSQPKVGVYKSLNKEQLSPGADRTISCHLKL